MIDAANVEASVMHKAASRFGADVRRMLRVATAAWNMPSARWSLIAATTAAIFVADTLTNLEIAVSVLYVVPILLSARGGRETEVLWVGLVCAGLSILSFVFSSGGMVLVGLANGGLSLVAISSTVVLAMRIIATAALAREAQSDLARLSRVLTVSELSTSIAHEVSQPLAAISANGSAALRWMSATPANFEEARTAMDRVVKEAERAGAVVDRVRRLVRRVPSTRTTVDLAEVVADSLELLRGELRGARVTARSEIAPGLPMIEADRIQIQQVILNLLVNGIEALAACTGDRHLTIKIGMDGLQIRVAVKDNGAGLPPDLKARVFEPFFTTKPSGTGVGLSVSRTIIETHGGAMFVDAPVADGVVIGFTLPVPSRDVETRMQ